MDDQRNIVYEYLIQTYKDKLYPEKNTDDINALVNLLMSGLEKGLTEIEWMDLINAIKSLPNSLFILSIAGSKSKEGNYHYYLIKKEKRKFGKIFFKVLKKIFASPKRRKYLADLEIKQEITEEYIINLIEEGIEKGFSRNQQVRFQELVYFLYYTIIEFTISFDTPDKKPLIKINSY
ncbi:MAG: hypothetical protein ACFFDW_11050 [Candidatus Thorarchaeota archaeon]